MSVEVWVVLRMEAQDAFRGEAEKLGGCFPRFFPNLFFTLTSAVQLDDLCYALTSANKPPLSGACKHKHHVDDVQARMDP